MLLKESSEKLLEQMNSERKALETAWQEKVKVVEREVEIKIAEI